MWPYSAGLAEACLVKKCKEERCHKGRNKNKAGNRISQEDGKREGEEEMGGLLSAELPPSGSVSGSVLAWTQGGSKQDQ